MPTTGLTRCDGQGRCVVSGHHTARDGGGGFVGGGAEVAESAVPSAGVVPALDRDDCQVDGYCSPLAWLTLSVTAISCGWFKSLAKLCRRVVVHPAAPNRHASARGTTWPMSTSEAAHQMAPSYGLYQRPDTAAQLLSVTTEVRSRWPSSYRPPRVTTPTPLRWVPCPLPARMRLRRSPFRRNPRRALTDFLRAGKFRYPSCSAHPPAASPTFLWARTPSRRRRGRQRCTSKRAGGRPATPRSAVNTAPDSSAPSDLAVVTNIHR